MFGIAITLVSQMFKHRKPVPPGVVGSRLRLEHTVDRVLLEDGTSFLLVG